MHRTSTPLTFRAFDVLSIEGRSGTGFAYSKRRMILEELDLNGRYWRTPQIVR